jgi:hypothetical protein
VTALECRLPSAETAAPTGVDGSAPRVSTLYQLGEAVAEFRLSFRQGHFEQQSRDDLISNKQLHLK